MRLLVLLSVVLLFLSGCTFVSTKSDRETNQAIAMPVPEGKSIIYVVRPSAYSAASRHFIAYLNGVELGVLGSSHFFAVIVTPGKYVVTTEIETPLYAKILTLGTSSVMSSTIEKLLGDQRGILIDALPGQKYYARLDVSMRGGKIEKARDASIFQEGTFTDPSLVKIIDYPGTGLNIKDL